MDRLLIAKCGNYVVRWKWMGFAWIGLRFHFFIRSNNMTKNNFFWSIWDSKIHLQSDSTSHSNRKYSTYIIPTPQSSRPIVAASIRFVCTSTFITDIVKRFAHTFRENLDMIIEIWFGKRVFLTDSAFEFIHYSKQPMQTKSMVLRKYVPSMSRTKRKRAKSWKTRPPWYPSRTCKKTLSSVNLPCVCLTSFRLLVFLSKIIYDCKVKCARSYERKLKNFFCCWKSSLILFFLPTEKELSSKRDFRIISHHLFLSIFDVISMRRTFYSFYFPKIRKFSRKRKRHCCVTA